MCEAERWRCSLASLVPLSVLQQGFPIEIPGGDPCFSLIYGLETEIQRHEIVKKKVWVTFLGTCFLCFSTLKGLLVFWTWARASFLFSISEPICDKLVLNRNKWCHFPSQMSVCHSTASFMIHSLSLLSLFCLWQDPPPPPSSMLLYLSPCLFFVHPVVFWCRESGEFPCLCFSSFLLQSLVLIYRY